MTMNDWPRIALRDIITQTKDRVSVEADKQYPNFGIYSFGRGLFAKPPIDGTSSSATSLFRAKAHQFVYSRLFAFEGAYGVVPAEFDGYFVSNEFPLFAADESKVIPDYLAWFFRNPAVWPGIARLTTGMGNRRQRIKPESLLDYEIPLPPLQEQHRIVSRIGWISAKLDFVRDAIEELESEMTAMLRSRFSRIVESAGRRTMEEVAPLVRRQAEIVEGMEYPELGVRSFGRGTFHKPPLDFLSIGSKRLYHIEPGDLVFSNVFAWEGAIAVAQQSDRGRFGSHRFITCVPIEGLATADFLCFYFLTPEGLRQINEASPGGAGRNRTLGLKKLAELQVPIPPYDQQIAFGRLLRKWQEIRDLRDCERGKLEAFVPSILNRAFRGEL